MKKLIISILFIICLAFGISAFAACGNLGGIGGNNIPTENQYNENITYKLSYTSEEECPNGNISDDKLHSSLNFEVDRTYYMVLDFTVLSFPGNWEILQAIVEFDPAEYITARLEEAATGSTGEREENGEKIITASYSIPEQRNEPKNYRVIYKFSGEQNLPEGGMSFNIGIAFITTANAIPEFQYWSFNYSGGLIFELNDETSEYTVTGLQDGMWYSKLVIPKSYNGKLVTSIGNRAFGFCKSLTSIIIPDSVTSIGEDAFTFCTNLKNVNFGENSNLISIGNRAFENCTSLESVYMTDINAWCNISFVSYDANPLYYAHNLYLKGQLITNLNMLDGVTDIKRFAFCNCTSLESITIPDSVTSIGWNAFNNCHNLKSIKVSDGNTFYTSKDGILYNKNKTELIKIPEAKTSVTIPNSVKSIGEQAFYNCTNLTSITIPDSVTSIGWAAFGGCTCLKSISIPDSVTSIGREAFYNCTNLTSITISNGVTSIGDSAFGDCTNLTSVSIPNSVNSIGWYAFEGCTSLTSVTFENNTGWKVSENADMSEAEIIDLTDPVQNAKFLTDTYRGYCGYYWKRA